MYLTCTYIISILRFGFFLYQIEKYLTTWEILNRSCILVAFQTKRSIQVAHFMSQYEPGHFPAFYLKGRKFSHYYYLSELPLQHLENSHNPLSLCLNYLESFFHRYNVYKLIVLLVFFFLESQNVDFVCSVLVVADQLLITRLKGMCEVALTEKREYF